MAEKTAGGGGVYRTAAEPDLDLKIEAWRKEHGEVAVFRTRAGVVVAKPPDQETYERFLDKAASDKGSKAAALRELAQLSAIYPDLDTVRGIFQKLPALPAQIGNACVTMAGGQLEGDIQKA